VNGGPASPHGNKLAGQGFFRLDYVGSGLFAPPPKAWFGKMLPPFAGGRGATLWAHKTIYLRTNEKMIEKSSPLFEDWVR